MILNSVDKYFSFLVNHYSFTKIPEYSYVREVHTDYIKDNLVINIGWDGGYFINLFTIPSEISQEVLSGKMKAAKVDLFTRKCYDLAKLDPGNKIYNSVSGDNFPEKEIWYYATLLKNHSEILVGDFNAFKLRNRLIKKLKKKNSR